MRILAPTRRAHLLRVWREGPPGPVRPVLALLSYAYRCGLFAREAAYRSGFAASRKLACPVVAVGNLTVGGTGKTPLVELLARRLGAEGRRVVILSRGYGGQGRDPVTVVSDGGALLGSVREAGDEPLLLARRLPGVPVVVGRDRYRAGALALARFRPDVLLLDDGLQQMRLRKDVEVVCLDAKAPWGRGGLLPAGSLREPRTALRRAHLVVLSHAGGEADLRRSESELRRWAPSAPVAHAGFEVEGVTDPGSGETAPVASLSGVPALAFAGLAAPERFGATLAGVGIVPRALVLFPDHHPYTRADLRDLEARARDIGAQVLLTTEKDAVRLPASGTVSVRVLRVRLRLVDPSGTWWATLRAHLGMRDGA